MVNLIASWQSNTTKPFIKWDGTFQYETPFFGRLDPPIAKTCHNHCVYMLSHDTFQSLFAKLIHTVIIYQHRALHPNDSLHQ